RSEVSASHEVSLANHAKRRRTCFIERYFELNTPRLIVKCRREVTGPLSTPPAADFPASRSIALNTFEETPMSFVLPLAALTLGSLTVHADEPQVIRSARSGPWSAADTWVGKATPGAGSRVLIRAGHRIEYDVSSEAVIRGINIAGTLNF